MVSLQVVSKFIKKMKNIEMKQAHDINDKERSDDVKIEENVTFSDMFLSDSILSGLHSCGFYKPSPIQLSAIPLGRCGLDLIVQAKSGTGKTCVFSIVALEMVCVVARTTQVLIVAPTREIAVQICQVITSLASAMPDLKVSFFIGGMSVEEDKLKLKVCHIVIGTPGRLNQLVTIGALNVRNVRLLVFDEADQLLNQHFKEDILNLVKTLPHNKQVLALSATYSTEITEFLDKFMRSPSHVRLGKEAPALLGVSQYVRLLPYSSQPHQRHRIKFEELLNILSTVSFNQCLVFSNSQLRAESISNQLKSNGWPSLFLTGGQVQEDRLKSYFALCSYKCRILVSTDLSARGLDSEHVNLVINLDVPNDQATYLHRVGRSGRYGSRGIAISIVCEGYEWESLRAVATLSNVQIKILQDNYDVNLKNYDNLEDVQHLSETKCAEWINKAKKNPLDVKNCKNYQNEKSNFINNNSGTSNGSTPKVKEEKVTKLNANSLNGIVLQHQNHNKTYNVTFDKILEDIRGHQIHLGDNKPVKINSCYKNMPSNSALQLIDKYLNISYNNLFSNDLTDVNCRYESSLIDGKNLSNIEQDINLERKCGNTSQIDSHEKSYEMLNISYDTLMNEKSNNSENCSHELNKGISLSKVSLNRSLKKKCRNKRKDGSENGDSNKICLAESDTKDEKLTKGELHSLYTGYGEWRRVNDGPKSNIDKTEDCQSFDNLTTQYDYSNDKYFNMIDDDFTENSDSEYTDYTDIDEYDSENSSICDDYPYYSHEENKDYYTSANVIVDSAVKFCDMMHYVQNAGKISARVAKKYQASFFSD